jgi:hypothetical protein
VRCEESALTAEMGKKLKGMVDKISPITLTGNGSTSVNIKDIPVRSGHTYKIWIGDKDISMEGVTGYSRLNIVLRRYGQAESLEWLAEVLLAAPLKDYYIAKIPEEYNDYALLISQRSKAGTVQRFYIEDVTDVYAIESEIGQNTTINFTKADYSGLYYNNGVKAANESSNGFVVAIKKDGIYKIGSQSGSAVYSRIFFTSYPEIGVSGLPYSSNEFTALQSGYLLISVPTNGTGYYINASNIGIQGDITDIQGEITDIQGDITDIRGDITDVNQHINSIEPLIKPVRALGWYANLTGQAIITPRQDIVLSQDGDSLECELDTELTSLTNDSSGYAGYGFARNKNNNNKIAIGAVRQHLYVRSDDNVWICQYSHSDPYNTFKIEYADGKINIYTNGVLRTTYNGQKTITIERFGRSSTDYGYWKGIIKSLKVNGVALSLSEDFILDKAELCRDNGFLTDEQQEVLDSVSNSNILITPVSASLFRLKILNHTSGRSLIHPIGKIVGSRVVDGVTYNNTDVWTAHDIKDESGNTVYQGNLNAIYRIGKVNGVSASDAQVNEDYHVGNGHGNEVAVFAKFFADGKEFDPANISEPIKCSSFRMLQKSVCYVVDSSKDTGNEMSYPKIVDGEMVVHGIHYIDVEYLPDNVIKWYNRFVQVRDVAVQYTMFCGGMVYGELSHNNNVMLNDVDNSWNVVTTDGSQASYAAPQGYESQLLYGHTVMADTVTMWGDDILIRQSMQNENNGLQSHACVYTMSNNPTSMKCYMQPVRTTYLANPDTFNKNDVIAVYLERKIEC